jgi:hypothetical protein
MIQETPPLACEVYADIYELPHWQSVRHPHMSAWERAAQFSAYKALSGYEDMVGEEARYVGSERILSETELDSLNRRLMRIAEAVGNGGHPVVTIRYFVPDVSKAGGSYTEITEAVRCVDTVRREVELMRKTGIAARYMRIRMDRISDIIEGSEEQDQDVHVGL